MLDNRNWTVYLVEHFKIPDGKTKIEWVKDYAFYCGIINGKFNLKRNWRFCEVKNKRKEAIYLGVVNTNFPIVFPLFLKNGKILKKI